MEQLPPEAEALIPKTSSPKNKVSDKGKSDSTPKSGGSERGNTFKRNLFVREEGTGVKVDKLGNKEQGKTPDKVSFSPELETEYKTFLDNYITNLSHLQEDNPEVLRTLEHKHDAELLTLLSDSEGKPDAKKIEEFLRKPEGWELATMALEYQTAMKLFALGLDAQVSPGGERSTVIDPQTIRLNVDRGVGNKFLHDKVLSYLNKHTRMTGERHTVPDYNSPFNQMLRNLSPKLPIASGLGFISGAGLYGGIIGGPVGGALGLGASALGVAGVTGVGRLMRDGVRIDTRQCSAAFQQIAGNPNEAIFVKRMFGVDINDFQDLGNNRIVRAQGRASESTNNKQVWDDVLSAFYTRESYYTALGIPPSRLDAGFYQMVGSYTTGQLEQTGTWTMQRFQEVFQPNNGGLTDNVADNISRSREAWRTVMREKMTSMIQKAKEKKGVTMDFETISAKLKEREEGGEIKKKKEKEFADRINKLTAYKEPLSEQQVKLENYRETLKVLDGIRDQIERMTTSRDIGSISTEITDVRTKLGNTTNPGTILGVKQAIIDRRTHYMDTAVANIPNGITGKARNERQAQIQADATDLFKDELSEIDQRVTEARKKIADLQELQRQFSDQQRKLLSSEGTVRDANRNVTDMVNNFNTVTAPAVGLTEVDLQTQSIADLIKRINTAHVVGAGATPAISVGWPESQNNRPENRQIVLRAMVEARARNMDPSITTESGRLTTIRGLGESYEQIMISTPNEIIARLPAGHGFTAIEISNIKEEVAKKLNIRIDSYKLLDKELQEQITVLEEEKEKVNLNSETHLLRVTQDLMTRQGELFGNTGDITLDPNKYVSTTEIRATDQYTEEEKATFNITSTAEGRLPSGYFELMNYVFDYQEKSNRGEYFGQLVKILPPQKFAEILNRSFLEQLGENSLNLPTVTETTIYNVILFMNQRIQTGAIGSCEMRNAFKAVIDELRNEARAL